MLGLIKKDLLMIKGNIKTIIIMMIVFLTISINEGSNLIFIPAFISIMVMMTTFSYDEYNKTDAYITSLPNGKTNAVKAKYIATLLVVTVTLILSFTLSYLVGLNQGNLDLAEIVMTTLGCGAGLIILQSILYPLIYKLGIEKGRIGIFIIVFGITTIGTILMKNGLSLKIPTSTITLLDNYGMIIIPLIILVILFISYKISAHIYNKKEF